MTEELRSSRARHVPTVDEALALVEQERLDMLVALEPDQDADMVESAPQVLASEVRKLRKALAQRSESAPAPEVLEAAIKSLAANLSSPPPDLIGTGRANKYAEEKLRGLVTLARSMGAPVEALAALMVKIDADVDICYPGNHGGPTDKWLLTVTRQDANDISEHFGSTLTEAIEVLLSERNGNPAEQQK